MPHDTIPAKTCTKCGETKPYSEFYKNKACSDGLHTYCKACKNAQNTQRLRSDHEARERQRAHVRRNMYNRRQDKDFRRAQAEADRERPKNHPSIARRREASRLRYQEDAMYRRRQLERSRKYPDRMRARWAVKFAVRRGDLPPAWAMVCSICNEAQAANYHHWHGYDEQNWLDVIAVCHPCHGKEHRRYD